MIPRTPFKTMRCTRRCRPRRSACGCSSILWVGNHEILMECVEGTTGIVRIWAAWKDRWGCSPVPYGRHVGCCGTMSIWPRSCERSLVCWSSLVCSSLRGAGRVCRCVCVCMCMCAACARVCVCVCVAARRFSASRGERKGVGGVRPLHTRVCGQLREQGRSVRTLSRRVEREARAGMSAPWNERDEQWCGMCGQSARSVERTRSRRGGWPGARRC